MGEGLNESQWGKVGQLQFLPLELGRVKIIFQCGRPAPISSFGAGQGENNISVSEFKGEIGPPPILPFGGGQCEFQVCMG